MHTKELLQRNSVLIFKNVTDFFQALKCLIRVEHHKMGQYFTNMSVEVAWAGLCLMLLMQHCQDLGLLLDHLAIGWRRDRSLNVCIILSGFHF